MFEPTINILLQYNRYIKGNKKRDYFIVTCEKYEGFTVKLGVKKTYCENPVNWQLQSFPNGQQIDEGPNECCYEADCGHKQEPMCSGRYSW